MILDGVRIHYSALGMPGLLGVVKSRVLGRQVQHSVCMPGIQHPVCVRLRTSDVTTLRQVLFLREYDWEFDKPPAVILDAGANIGLTAVFYANKYPSARIIALEPETSNYEMLLKNTAPYPNIVPLLGALWRENAKLSIHDPGLGHYGYQVREIEGTVPGYTVEHLMARYGISFLDLLKVDIEGAEREVFAQPEAWIEKVGIIAIELHDRLRGGCSRTVYRATQAFQSHWVVGETVFFANEPYVRSRLP